MATYARKHTGYAAGDDILTKYLSDEFATIFTALGTGGIGSDQLASSAVIEAKIGTGAVTETKIGTGAVTNTKLGAGAVTNAKITDGTITTAKIANVSPATFTGQQSITFCNGFILKWGNYTAVGGGWACRTISYTVPFPTETLTVVACESATGNIDRNSGTVASFTASGFVLCGHESTFRWIAIGR